MLTRESAINKVDKFTHELLDNGIPLQRVVLFGSYAKNEQKDGSDIDVALFSDMFSGFGFKDKQLFALVNIKNEFIDIDTKTFSSKNYNDSPLMEVIENTGIEIFNSNKK